MNKVTFRVRLTTAGLAALAAIVITDGVGQAVDPQLASFEPVDRTSSVLVDYTLGHHGVDNWPRHKSLVLGGGDR